MYGMEMTEETYYGEITQYMDRYLWGIEDRLPKSDAELRTMFNGHTAEYYNADKIRDAAIREGGELKRHFATDKGERTNSSALDYIHRIRLLKSET